MLRDKGQVNRLVGRIYEAALDSARWREVLAALCASLNGAAFQLYTIDIETRKVVQQWDYGLPQQFTAEYCAYYSKLSERNDIVLRNPNLTVLYDHMFFDEAEMDRSEMYRWREGFGFRHFIGGQLIRTKTTLSMAAIQRSKREGHASQREIEAFAAFLPHMARALRIQDRIGILAQDSSSAWTVIEDASFGVIVLNGSGRVWRCNREAERMITDGGEIDRREGKLVAKRPIDNAALQRLIAGAIETAHGCSGDGGGSMALAKRNGSRPYAVLVAPVAEGAATLAPSGPAAVVTLTDPDHAPETPALVRPLRQGTATAVGLSSRERECLQWLAQGLRNDRIAERMGISNPTVEMHFARARRKLGAATREQALAKAVALGLINV